MVAHPQAGQSGSFAGTWSWRLREQLGSASNSTTFSCVTSGGLLHFSASTLRHICNGEQDNTCLFSSCMGKHLACSNHPETVSYCHGGDCELRESRCTGLLWPPDPGQRAVPQVWSRPPDCEGGAWRVAGEAVTVDNVQVMLISAACPLNPQPTTGTQAPRLVDPLLVFH